MEDNNVYVKIKLDTSGFKLGTKEMSQHVADVTSKLNNMSKSAKANCASSANAFIKQNQAVASASAEVEKLSNELTALRGKKTETDWLKKQFSEVDKDIEASKKELTEFQIELGKLTKAGKGDSVGANSIRETMGKIKADIARQEAYKEGLKSDPRAYTSADTSALEEKLARAKERQADATNKASTAYQKFNSVLEKNSNTLRQNVKNSNKSVESSLNLNKSFKKGLTTILKYGFGIRSLYIAWRKLRQAVIEGVGTLAKEDATINHSLSAVKTQLNTLKNSFASAFAPLINIVAPIIENFLKKLNALMRGLSQFIAILTGNKTYKVATEQWQDYAGALDKTSKSAKKAKKYLSGLDEIQLFTPKDDESGAGGANAGKSFEELPVQANKWTDAIEKLKKRLGELKDAFKKGFNDAFKSDKWEAVKDNIKEIGKTLARIWNNPEVATARKEWENSLAHLAGSIAGATASIGVSLAYGVTEGVKNALNDQEEFIVSKAKKIYSNLTDANDTLSEFFATLAEIAQAVFENESFSSLVEKITELGIWALGNGCEAVTGFFKDLVHWLVDPIIANGDKVATVLNDIVEILDLLIPDMGKLHDWDYSKSGFHAWVQEMITNRIDTMTQKLENLHQKLTLLKEAIQAIKDAGGLKEWFKANFTWDAFWQGIANGFLQGFYGLLNKIIDGLNSLMGADVRHALNTISGGKLNIIDKKIPNIPVPALATGAVIPPNAPFMAMLGDQRNGTNLEMPENLLRQVVREEGGSNGNYTFVAQINRRTLFEEMINEAKLRQSASGRNPFEFA